MTLKFIKSLGERVNVYTLTSALIFVIFWVMYYLYPIMRDDNEFLQFMGDFNENPTVANFFKGWWDNIYLRFTVDNLRLPQLISTGFLMLPKWLTAAVYSGATTLMFIFSARLSGVWQQRLLLYTLLSFALYFALPWFEHMFVGMFNLNYIASTAIMLWAFMLLVQGRPWSIWAAAALGLLCGWMHEGYGATAIGGAVFCLLLPELRTRRTVAFILGSTVALLFLGLCVPGTQVRSATFVPPTTLQGLIDNLRYTLKLGSLCYSYVAIFIITAICRRTRKIALAPIPLICLGASLGGMTVFVCCLIIRTAWPMMVMSLIGLFYFGAYYLPQKKSRVSALISLVLWGVIAVQGAACIPWFIKARSIEDVYMAHRDLYPRYESVFADFPTTILQPWYTFARPNPGTNALYIKVAVPEQLADFAPEKAKRVGGDEENPYWLYKDIIVTTFPGYHASEEFYIWAAGKPHRQYSELVPFTVDGRRYAFVNPRAYFFESKINKLRNGAVLDSVERSVRSGPDDDPW